MSTSLAEQLRKLTVPQTSNLGKNDKKRISLLFDPKEAANITRETFYSIGVDGLEELIARNASFEFFQRNLFHISAKDFERSVQNSKDNKKLNTLIRHFLLCLSPYFMLHSSYKALEWLIYRYQIHEYNKEDILMLILPYHETNIFVRTLQLLNLKKNDEWIWLEPLQKPGIHLAKLTLYNHAASSPYFIRFISNTIKDLIENNVTAASVIYNFYCTTFTGALEFAKDVNENHVTEMIPCILKGLSSTTSDYCAASLIILAKLLNKVTLTDVLLEKFIEKITNFNIKTLRTESIMILIILFQKQEHFSNLSDAINRLIEADWLVHCIKNLQQNKTHVKPFLKVIMEECIKIGIDADNQTARLLVVELLQSLTYEKDTIGFLISTVLKHYNPKVKYSDEIMDWIKGFMKKLEVSYPAEYDDEIIIIMKNSNGEFTKKRKRLKKLIENSISVGGQYDLFDKLYHPDVSTRKTAMKFIIKSFDKASDREKQFLKTSIIQHLKDEDYNSVRDTLQISSKILTNIIENNELVEHLLEILLKCQLQTNWLIVSRPALKILCSIADPNDIKIFFKILPFLLPTTSTEIKSAKVILNSPYAKNNAFLKTFYQKFENEDKSENIFNAIYNSLNKNIELPDIRNLLIAFKSTSEEENNALHKYMATLLLSATLPENCPADITSLILDILIMYSETSKLKAVKSDETIVNFIQFAKKNKFPLQGLLMCMENLFLKTKLPDVSLSHLDLCEENDFNKFYLVLMDILLKGCSKEKQLHVNIYTASKDKFFKHFTSDLSTKINTYLNMCVTDNKFVSPDFQMQCLKMVLTEIKRKSGELTKCMNLCNLFIPYLLACAGNPNVELRKLAIICLTLSTQIVGVNPDDSYLLLVAEILSCKEEIIMDHEQLAIIIDNIFKKYKGKKLPCLSAFVDVSINKFNPICLRADLMKLLSKVQDINVFEKTAPVAREILEQRKDNFTKQESQILYYNCIKFTEDLGSELNLNTNAWKLLESSLKDFKKLVNFDDVKKCPAQITLESINATFFSNLKEPIQKELLSLIIYIGTFTSNPEVISEINRFVKKIDLDMNLVIEELKNMRDVKSPKANTSIKRRRVSVLPTPDILDTDDWKKGVTVLEIIQDKKKIRFTNTTISILFDILKKCLDFDEQSSVEYPKQLLLSNILHCCLKLNNEEIKQGNFNIELVVQCIRASQNPQTHHHALLVLSQIAALLPRQVLHHIMAIFTFMGSSVLRHDDAYSLQIITKIIDTIIPILTEDASLENIINVLRVFVDVILDVPEHRRIPMYTNLIIRMGDVKNLYVFLLLMFEGHVLHPDKQRSEKDSSEEMPKRLAICANLCKEFSPAVIIETCVKLIQYVHKLPEEITDIKHDKDLIFDTTHKTPKQYRHYKYTIITFIASVLSSNEFVNQIAELSDEEIYQMENLYKDMIISTLTFIQILTKVSQKNANTNQSQYWKVMLHHSYDILDSTNALLTPQMFLLVIKGLMVHSLATVKRRAMELLNSKLQHNETFFDECDESELYAILPALINMIKVIDDDEELDSEQELIVQTALLSLKLLVRKLSAKSPEKFVDILNFLTDLVKTSDGNLLASLMLCVAELCHCIKAHAIQNLIKFMPSVIKVLKMQRQEMSHLLLLSGLTAVNKILDSLSLFLSPFLEKLLNEITSLASKFNIDSDDPKVQPIISKLLSIKQKIGNLIPLRVLIPNLTNVYNNKVSGNDFISIAPLMEIFTECIDKMQRNELNNNLTELNAFFLIALDFRVQADATNDQANFVEMSIINSFISYILKLSESTFKPIYYRIYDWAIRNDAKTERIITFYHLSSNMADRLKGLFVHFAGHFLTNASSILDECNINKSKTLYFEDNDKNTLLLEHVLKTLMFIFMYDNQKFINKERFGVLMQPIVEQLENELEDIDELEERAKKLIVPCLVQFTVATGNDALWKQTNYQILLKMRHTNPRIRIIALECLTEIARKLGEDFLPLLPETIPFLAELLEDEEENVEKSCQKTVQELEKILGEPLQKYF